MSLILCFKKLIMSLDFCRKYKRININKNTQVLTL